MVVIPGNLGGPAARGADRLGELLDIDFTDLEANWVPGECRALVYAGPDACKPFKFQPVCCMCPPVAVSSVCQSGIYSWNIGPGFGGQGGPVIINSVTPVGVGPYNIYDITATIWQLNGLNCVVNMSLVGNINGTAITFLSNDQAQALSIPQTSTVNGFPLLSGGMQVGGTHNGNVVTCGIPCIN